MYKKIALMLTACLLSGLVGVVVAVGDNRGTTVVIEDTAEFTVLLPKANFEVLAAERAGGKFAVELLFNDDFQVIIDDTWKNLTRELERVDARSYADQRAFYQDYLERALRRVDYQTTQQFKLELKKTKWEPKIVLPDPN